MALDPITTSVATYAAKELIRNAVGKTYEFILKKHSTKHKLGEIAEFKAKYIEYCEKILHIKTLASQERSVFIDEIYVPLRLKGINTLSIWVDDATILDYEKRAILIKGYAGMGKSTILRKLLANSAKSNDRLPLFYELKHYRGGTIEAAISKNLGSVGIPISPEQVGTILSDSNVRLYLDAFDETPPAHRDELIDEISRVINGHKCHLICTTRPDTELDSMVNVETFNVDILSHSQIVEIINKTSADADKARSLCEALDRSPLHKGPESILKSPILVVLFCVSYNLGEEIPSTLSQFYANIFDTIFYRHDNLKGKVNRARHWNDNRRIYKALFEYLCFISQRSGMDSFSRGKLVDFVAHSLEYMNENKSLADLATEELTSITNLIIEDGFNEYRYIHKSIQEFFSAAFICTLKPEKKYGFYKRCRDDSSFFSVFSNTLFFLEELDYYDYAEHFLVPSVSDLLHLNNEAISDKYLPSGSLVSDFQDSVIFGASQVKIQNSKLKRVGIEEKLLPPELMREERMPIAKAQLFGWSKSLLEVDNRDDRLLKFLMEHGERDGDIYRANLSRILDEENLCTNKPQDVLLLGIGVLFLKKYNVAIQHLKNRKKQVEGQGYLDF
jgi:hypothetical protein